MPWAAVCFCPPPNMRERKPPLFFWEGAWIEAAKRLSTSTASACEGCEGSGR